jgi:hypothetical protein
MSYDLSIEERPSYLHAKVRGTHNEQNAHRFLVDVHEAWVRRNSSAVLLEMNLDGPSLSVLSIFNIISERAPYAFGLKRIAYVDRGRGHDPEQARFAETVARNRGVNVRLFWSVDEAEDWLREWAVPEVRAASV